MKRINVFFLWLMAAMLLAAPSALAQVTLSGTAHVTGNVYGGGDAAAVSGQTNVILRD